MTRDSRTATGLVGKASVKPTRLPAGAAVVKALGLAAQAWRRRGLATLGLLGLISTSWAHSLAIDPTFRPMFTTTEGSSLAAVAVQADGRLLVAGTFDLLQGRPCNGLARLDPQGNVDPDFAFWPGVEGSVNTVVIQPDGAILVGGRFTRVNGEPRPSLARVHADGRLDDRFKPVLGGADGFEVFAVRVQADGRVVVGGDFRSAGHLPRRGIVRLLPDGSVDEEFAPGAGAEDAFGAVHDLALVPGGQVIAAGYFTKFNGFQRPGLVRLDSAGGVDPGFTPMLDWTQGLPAVQLVRRQPDGKLLVAGRFDRIGATPCNALARLEADGALDEGFQSTEDWGGRSANLIRDLAVLKDGRILVAGEFERLGQSSRAGILRLRVDGDLDDSFDPGEGLRDMDGTVVGASAIALQPDGRVTVVGGFEQIHGQPRHHLGRLWPNGALDADFCGPNWRVERGGAVLAVHVQADGRLVVGGDFERVNGVRRRALARLDADGNLDAGFDAGIADGGVVNALAAAPDRKLMVAGRFARLQGQPRGNVARLLPDGTLDAQFDPGEGPNGEVYCAAVQSDGAVVLGGDFDWVNGFPIERIARLDANGVVDAGFRPRLAHRNDLPEVYSILATTNGPLLIAGYFDRVNNEPRANLASLQSDGTLDPAFDPELTISGALPLVVGMAMQPDGRIVIGGTFEEVDGRPRAGIARLGPDGSLDAGFAPGTGISGGEPPAINALAVEPGGELFVVGEFSAFNTVPRLNLARLNANGSLDIGFDPGLSMNGWGYAVAVEGNGGVLVGGPFTAIAGQPRPGLARFLPATPERPVVNIRLDHGEAVVTWTSTGHLQFSDSALGPWIDLPAVVSPAQAHPTHAARFYRVAP